MTNRRSRIVLFCALWGIVLSPARAEGLFLDPQFEVKLTSDVVYGQGPVQAPAIAMKDLLLDVYEPQGEGLPSALPAIVLIHGGGFRGGDKAQRNFAQLSREMAARGYVTFSINYRLIPDNPDAPGATERQRAIAAAVADAGKAMQWVHDNAETYRIDPTRIAIGGGSAGAITALFSTYGESGRAQLVRGIRTRAVINLWGGLYDQVDRIQALDPPMIIIHGTNDQTVKFSLAEDIVKRCKDVGVTCELYAIEGAGHGVPLGMNYEGEPLYQKIAKFLHAQMKLAS